MKSAIYYTSNLRLSVSPVYNGLTTLDRLSRFRNKSTMFSRHTTTCVPTRVGRWCCWTLRSRSKTRRLEVRWIQLIDDMFTDNGPSFSFNYFFLEDRQTAVSLIWSHEIRFQPTSPIIVLYQRDFAAGNCDVMFINMLMLGLTTAV